MHLNPRRILPIVLLLAILAAAAYWYFSVYPAQADSGALMASGTIEVIEVDISAELSGKVTAVDADEGDAVVVGDVLMQFDTTLLEAQRAQAQGSLDAAKANLALLQAGPTEDQLSAAQAQLAQAEANRSAVQASLDTLTAGTRPEDLTAAYDHLTQTRTKYFGLTVILSSVQVDTLHVAATTSEGNLSRAESRQDDLASDARNPDNALDAAEDTVTDAQAVDGAAQAAYEATQEASTPYYLLIEMARKTLDLAETNLTQAEARRDALDADDNMTTDALDAAESAVTDAQQMVDDAQAAYDELTTGDWAGLLDQAWQDVLSAQSRLNGFAKAASTSGTSSTSVETLLNQLDAAVAQRDVAQANLNVLESGSRDEQIQAAQAQVDMAQAALQVVEAQIAKMTIVAPVDGVVLARTVQPGEFASPGAPLLVLGRLDTLTITVYAPEDRYGTINLGQAASVTVDSYPGVTFSATVVYIAGKAEFTPRNVQTADGRRTTVFAVKLSVTDSEGRLKPGMPADVEFGK